MKIKKHELRNIIITGKAGSGKGVRMDILAEEFGLKKLSTGDIFRDIISKNTPLAKKVKKYYDAGELVPDDITNEVFAEYFKKHNYRGCILDGYPRTIKQAKFLMELLEKNGSKVDIIIQVHREDKDIVEHVVYRHTCKECARIYHIKDNPPKKAGVCDVCGGKVGLRRDDCEENLRMRLNVFREQVEPMIEFLKSHNIHFIIVPGKVDPYSKEAIKKSIMDKIKDKIEL